MSPSSPVATPIRSFLPIVPTIVVLLASMLACGRDAGSSAATPNPDTLRSIAQGPLLGSLSELGAHVWRGVPFAEPPVGELRWRAPLQPEPWPGRLEALRQGPSCVQFAGPGGGADGAGSGEPTGREDCLALNIFAPPFAPDEVPTEGKRLPVMVWIHGGGNSVGDSRLYDGSRLALAHRVIVVTVHYRLGVLGWFAHRALPGPGTSAKDRSGNYGTLDLIRSLEWVRDNIGAFGGDPGRVTVFGESAGGTNVFSLLLSPAAAGLFQRAISQSGSVRTYTMADGENPIDAPVPGREKSSHEVLVALLVGDGRGGDRVAAEAVLDEMRDEEIAAYLRGKSPSELLSAFDGDQLGGMYRLPTLLRDGTVLPLDHPLDVFGDAKQYNAVPAILGTNRDENKLFLLFSSPAVSRIFGIPLRLKDEDLYDATALYETLMWKATGVDEPADAMRAAQGPTVFAYRFDWDEEPHFLWNDFSKLLGAAHGLEIPFVFGGLSLGPATRFVFDEDKRDGYQRLSQQMMSYWTEFAYTGDPGGGRGGGQLRWEPWGGANGETARFMLLDSEEDGGLRMNSEVVSRDEIIARVLRDARFPSWRERCSVLRSFVEWGERMTEEAYRSVGEGACRAYPLDADS